MTTYGAYDAGLKCKNPACKSYGTAHPNCRCYGDFAEGGEASFCSQERAHGPECEYFADGGAVEGFVPDDQFVEDQPGAGSDFVPDSEFKPDPESTAAPQNDFVPDDKFVPDAAPPKDYGTTGQQILAGIEGAAEGIAGGIAPFAEHHLLGEPYEAITARAEANPWTHGLSEAGAMAASMVAGVGVAGRIAQGASAVTKAAEMGAMGSAIMKGAITNGLLQASDEVSKWVLGQGDPHDAAGAVLAHMGASAMIGGIFGAAGTKASEGLSKLAESKFGERAEFFLHGLAEAAKNPGGPRGGVTYETEGLRRGLSESAERGFKAGQKAYDAITGKLLPATLGATAEGYAGYKEDGLIGGAKGVAKGALHGIIAGLVGKGIGLTYGKVAAPVAAYVLAHGGHGFVDAMDHAIKSAAGSDALSRSVDSLCKSGTVAGAHAYGSPSARKKLSDYLENGGDGQALMDEQNGPAPIPGFAEGGEVAAPDPVATARHDTVARLYPQQNAIIQAARGRMMGYLNGLRPEKHAAKLAFDDEPDQREQKKTYARALDIANAPLGILHDVARGTLTASDVAHFNALHPEVNGLLQKRLAERLTKAQVDGKKPSYKVRQSLSLLMGTALSGELTPQAIQAAQATFVAGKRPDPNQPQGGPKKSTSKLSKSSQAYLSDDQARMRRQQKD